MSLLSAIKAFLRSNENIPTQTPVWVEFMGVDMPQMVVLPVPGVRILEQYIDGSSRRSFPFVIQSVESTADEISRLESAGFYEQLADWFEDQNAAGIFPSLDSGKEPEKIEVTGWGLLQQTAGRLGVYQMSCRLIYHQIA